MSRLFGIWLFGCLAVPYNLPRLRSCLRTSAVPQTPKTERPAVWLLARSARNAYHIATSTRRSVRACASNAHVGVKVAFI